MLRTPCLRRERDRTLSHRRLGLRAAVGDGRCVLLIISESDLIRWETITVWCGPPSEPSVLWTAPQFAIGLRRAPRQPAAQTHWPPRHIGRPDTLAITNADGVSTFKL